jgi:hypothetical protein
MEKKINSNNMIMEATTLDIVCATEIEEFYYEGTDEIVPEGEPIGLDIDVDEGVKLVLFSNIYWNPQY